MRIICRDVGVSRKKKILLTGISCDIEPGSFVGLVGPNGAGKTTFLRCLARCDNTHSGLILFGDSENSEGSSAMGKVSIAFVPEDMPIPFPFSVLDIVLMGRFPAHQGNPSQKDRALAMNAMSRVGIAKLATRDISSLSTGERKKATLARALASGCKVLVFDELIANLDIRAQLEVMELLRDLATKDGSTIVLSIHDIPLAKHFTTHVLLLKDSRQVAFGQTADALTKENILSTFGVYCNETPLQGGLKATCFSLCPSDDSK